MTKNQNLVETLMGLVVLAVAGFFVSMAYQKTTAGGGDGYPLKAIFTAVDGLKVGSDVRIGGIKVGVVTHMEIQPETHVPTITFRVQEGITIPVDSKAKITSSGLLGDKYLDVTRGGQQDIFKSGDTLYDTQAPVNLEALIGKAIFNDEKK